MRKVHPTAIKTLSNPLPKRLISVERLLAQENARDRQADTLEDLAGDLNDRTVVSGDAVEVYTGANETSGYRFYQEMDDAVDQASEILTYITGTSAQMNISAIAPIGAPWDHAALNLEAYNGDDAGYVNPYLAVGSDGIIVATAPYFDVNAFIDTPNSAPTATVGAAGSVPVGTYYYGVTFYGGGGETPLVDAAISAPVTIASWAAQVDLTDIPIGPKGTYATDYRKIYRMNAAVGNWYYVGYVADNTSTTYTDNSASTSGLLPPAWNTSGALWLSPNTNRIMSGGYDTVLPVTRCWPPSAPVAAQVATGTGSIPNGTYRYKVSFQDGVGESSASPASNAVVVDNTHKQTTVTLPIGPENITGRRVYRMDTATGVWEFMGVIADNTTLSMIDNAASGAADQPARTSGIYMPSLPTYHKWKVYEMTASGTLGWAETPEQIEGDRWSQSSPANGNWLRTPGFIAEAGTWTVTVLGVSGNNRCRLDWYLDGVLVESAQEWYSASTTYNVEKTFTITPTAGWHQLTAIVNGKHASSSNYYYSLTSVRLLWVAG